MIVRAGFVFAIALAVSVGSADVDAQDATAGIVSEVSGTWKRLRDGRSLSEGNSVLPGDQIAAETAGKLSIMSFATGDVVNYECSPLAAACQFFRMPAGQKAPTGFLAYVSRLFIDERPRPARLAVARGFDPDGPIHGLLELQQGRGDLTPLLKGLPAGQYQLDCVNLDTGQEQQIDTWRSGTPAVMPLAPGLHALRVTDGDGATRGTAAVVLVLEKPSPEATRSWQEFVTVTGDWQSVSRDALDTVAYRVLRDLADRHVR